MRVSLCSMLSSWYDLSCKLLNVFIFETAIKWLWTRESSLPLSRFRCLKYSFQGINTNTCVRQLFAWQHVVDACVVFKSIFIYNGYFFHVEVWQEKHSEMRKFSRQIRYIWGRFILSKISFWECWEECVLIVKKCFKVLFFLILT